MQKRTIGKKRLGKFVTVALLIGGIGLVFYPVICNTWNQYKNDRIISQYEGKLEELSSAQSKRLIKQAKEYNRSHSTTVVNDSFHKDRKKKSDKEYEKILNPLLNGIMGYIEIPKIRIRLAIYHGTDETVLEEGCGHVEGTSIPVGGKGTHSILAAHRGLPSAKLFTDIDELTEGDIFVIYVANRTLAYRVDNIKVVKPDELDAIQNNRFDDRVTLLTCTPYGVNSHRLLVSGCRTTYKNERLLHFKYIKYLVLAALVITILLVILIYRRKRHLKK